ncbi:uncharacterized protein At5g01610-like [Macadamia integrifolia]|uniref:uncharacterized protein At5g01610-like n=1 Tax=Macadamia integrifolia TaxID=60698 RepID=UPI001C4F5C7D|nr:uncharacterized protein At5g01610-like [Macadamia integrifolia]
MGFFSLRPRLLSSTALLCFSFLFLSSLTAADENLTAYEILQSYDFPVGLLHTGVSGYDFDTSTGKFAVYLNETCSFNIQNSYELNYRSTIKGYITKGKISQLQGISVKVFLFWVNIIEVTRIGDQLEFSVGITSADFPVANFDECPQCGCGFDCKKGQLDQFGSLFKE